MDSYLEEESFCMGEHFVGRASDVDQSNIIVYGGGLLGVEAGQGGSVFG
jgi:hypothetical protein